MLPTTRATVPGAYARSLVELTARWDVRPKELLAGLGLDVEDLADPELRIGLGRFATLVRRAEEQTMEPGLAFHMGMHLRIASHGFLGFAALAAGTLGEALGLAERFVGTRTTALGFSHEVEGGRAFVVIEERAPLEDLRSFAVLTIAVTIAQIANALTGRRLTGDIECAFPEPEYVRRFRHVVPGSMRFDRPANRLVFAASVLELPLVSADPVALQLARAQCERELAALADRGGLLEDVRAELFAKDGKVRALDDVATRLHLSTRSLKRRLKERGTNFRQIRDSVLEVRARTLLEREGLTIDQIAATLGYSDSANFTRAFRRWTGTTPTGFRGDIGQTLSRTK